MDKIRDQFPSTKALIVEDNLLNLEVTKDMLELMRFTVDTAELGEDAIKLVQENEYDVILMDIQLPQMDGYEVVQTIKKLPGFPKHTKIIAVTANAMSGDREKCLDAGMDDYISKPIELKSLADILKKNLPHKHVSTTFA